MPLTDSHAHLDMYADDLPEVLIRAKTAGVDTILAIGLGDGPHEMHRALEIAEEVANSANAANLPTLYASAGIHPQEAHQVTSEALARLTELIQNPRCIAVGEIGLDYYHIDNPIVHIQQTAFVSLMQVAATACKPILIHCRTSELATSEAKDKFGTADAWQDLLALLDAHWSPASRGNMPAGILHCFSGTLDQARRSLDLGFYLSFAGNLTYPRAVAIREAAAYAPADRILVETDAPFLAPIPLRGQRNEPALVAHTAAALAALRGISAESLAELTSTNFARLFPSTQQAKVPTE